MSVNPISSAAQASPPAAASLTTNPALVDTPGRHAATATVPPASATSVTAAADTSVAGIAPVAAKIKVVQDAALTKAVDSINRFINPVASSIQFSIDETSGRTLVKVIDTDTNTVLRQFPSKEALAISQELDKLQGLLVKEKA